MDSAPEPEVPDEGLKEVAKGLQYLHSKGLIHRDIKSENILVGVNWEIRIIDFGTSRFIGRVDSASLESMMGTAGMQSHRNYTNNT